MKSTLMIKDLSLDKELDGREMSAVRGGFNATSIGSFNQAAIQGGGFASPNTQVGVFTPVVTNTDVNVASLTNVLGNMNARLAQI
ncbi:hypothetical protein ACFQAT_12440 [Undibacterium arcticum]|uniref:Uncharacterized protein n=1 Tax=Undibacterium arcticum TaxID=1762892 RepID=A0ABV7F6H2_9BURK